MGCILQRRIRIHAPKSGYNRGMVETSVTEVSTFIIILVIFDDMGVTLHRTCQNGDVHYISMACLFSYDIVEQVGVIRK